MRLSVYKSMSSDDMHSRKLKELSDMVVELLSITFEKLWLSGDWKKRNIIAILKKAETENRGNYRLMGFMSEI